MNFCPSPFLPLLILQSVMNMCTAASVIWDGARATLEGVHVSSPQVRAPWRSIPPLGTH